jgi:hypothetical protein
VEIEWRSSGDRRSEIGDLGQAESASHRTAVYVAFELSGPKGRSRWEAVGAATNAGAFDRVAAQRRPH